MDGEVKIITLRKATKCSVCGALLPIGTKVISMGPGHAVGMDCHSKVTPSPVPETAPAPASASPSATPSPAPGLPAQKTSSRRTILLLVVVLAVFAIGIFVFFKSQSKVEMPAKQSTPAASPSSDETVTVKGYYRKDGTYVKPHTRKKHPDETN